MAVALPENCRRYTTLGGLAIRPEGVHLLPDARFLLDALPPRAAAISFLSDAEALPANWRLYAAFRAGLLLLEDFLAIVGISWLRPPRMADLITVGTAPAVGSVDL